MEENVLRLDVAMNNTVTVRVVECARGLLRNTHRLIDRELPFALDADSQRLAGDDGHHIVEKSVGFARVEQREDVRVLELCGGLDLREEPLAAQRSTEVGVKHLDGDVAVVLDVVREEHRRHSAGADLTADVVPSGECCLETLEGRRHFFDFCFSSSNQLSTTTTLLAARESSWRTITNLRSSGETSYWRRPRVAA